VRTTCARLILAIFVCFADVEAADRSVQPILSRIARAPVESSGLARIGYSRKLRALEVEFRHGRIYRYEEVPPTVYRDLLTAESKTRFYNNNIRGKYRCLRVQRPRAQ
jgi:hypothetical protein